MLRTVLTRRFLFLLVSIFGLNSMGCSQTRMPNSGPSVEPFEADDRLEVPAIHEILRVAEPNDIPILLHGQGLVEIISDQTNADEYAYAPFGMEGGEQTPELLHHSDGSPYVKIVPVRLGKLTIRLTASFVDGGFALQVSHSGSGAIESLACSPRALLSARRTEWNVRCNGRGFSSVHSAGSVLLRNEGANHPPTAIRDI